MSYHGQESIPFGCFYILILGRSNKQRRVMKHLSIWIVVLWRNKQDNCEDFRVMSTC